MRGLILPLLLLGLVSCASGEVDVSALADRARDGEPKAARKLVQAMGSEEGELALEAYRAVTSLGKAMESALRAGLRSADEDVREASCAALGSLGSSQNVPYLIQVMGQGGDVSYAAVWALGEIGDPEAIPALVDVLTGPRDVLRKAAVRSLVKVGAKAGEHVQPLLENPPDPAAERAAIRVFGEIQRREAVPQLIRVTGRNRDAAVWALGRIGDPRALGPLLDALGDDRWQVRRGAAEALGHLEDERAVKHLAGLLEDPEAVVREWAARSLETITGRPVLYRDEDGQMIPPYNLYR
jgi:HEAT repeat protein